MSHTESLEIFPLKILRDLTQLSFLGLPSRPGASRPLFDLLERHSVSLKFLLEGCAGDDSRRDLIICIDSDSYIRLESELNEIKTIMQPQELLIRRPIAVVRMLGPHFDIRPGTSAMLFSALAQAGIPVFSNATTITSSMCVIPDDQVEAAERAISRTFEIPKKKSRQ